MSICLCHFVKLLKTVNNNRTFEYTSKFWFMPLFLECCSFKNC